MVTDAPSLFGFVLSIINNYIVPVIFAVAFVVFILGIYRFFIYHGGNSEKVAEGRKFVVWSILGFILMFSIWGLINIFMNTLGFSSSTRPAFPTFGAPATTGAANTTAPTNAATFPGSTGTYTTGGGGSTNYNPTNTVTSSSNCGSFDTGTGSYGTVCSTGYFCNANHACQLSPGVDPNSLTAQCGSFNGYDCPNGESCNSNGMCGATGNTSAAATGQQCTDNTVAPVGGSCYDCGQGVTTASRADCPFTPTDTKCGDTTVTTGQCITCQSGQTTGVAANCSENGGSL